jgi:hypothetical protein
VTFVGFVRILDIGQAGNVDATVLVRSEQRDDEFGGGVRGTHDNPFRYARKGREPDLPAASRSGLP